jgi:hypothetical protein
MMDYNKDIMRDLKKQFSLLSDKDKRAFVSQVIKEDKDLDLVKLYTSSINSKLTPGYINIEELFKFLNDT